MGALTKERRRMEGGKASFLQNGHVRDALNTPPATGWRYRCWLMLECVSAAAHAAKIRPMAAITSPLELFPCISSRSVC